MQGDKALRDKSIPFLSTPAEGGSSTYGKNSISAPESFSGNTKVVPMTRPEKGDITSAELFMQFTAPSDRALQVQIGIGTWVESGGNPTTVPETSYLGSYIAEKHRQITSLDEPFSVAANGTLTIDANLLMALPRPGDDNYLSDMFVLLITFNEGISTANGYSLDKFKLSCAAQIGFNR